jgi:hypothetical protein
MPHSRRWKRLLAEIVGKPTAAAIIRTAQKDYRELLAAGSPISISTTTLRHSLNTRIFPGLSLYRALSEFIPDTTDRLNIVEKLFRADFFGGMTLGIRLLNNLRDPFPFIRPVLRIMTKQPYLPGSQILVEDSPECYALDSQRCFTLDVLTALNAKELTVLYCKTDDWLSEALPKVRWLRTKTLAQGDEKCDFRWCR